MAQEIKNVLLMGVREPLTSPFLTSDPEPNGARETSHSFALDPYHSILQRPLASELLADLDHHLVPGQRQPRSISAPRLSPIGQVQRDGDDAGGTDGQDPCQREGVEDRLLGWLARGGLSGTGCRHLQPGRQSASGADAVHRHCCASRCQEIHPE